MSARRVVDALLARVGRRLVVGTPLGLGKANHVLNELFRRAAADGSIDLTIVTALTLEVPVARSDMERRFLEPLNARLFDGYPELEYATARRAGTLPPNVRVHEFFLTPGKYLNVATAQQDYISSNYTHAARDMLARGVNVILQMISAGTGDDAGRYSLSCNPDVTLDLVPQMRARGAPCAIVGEINAALPFMYGDAEVGPEYFDLLCAVPGGGYTLFGTPKTPVTLADHAIGLYASALIKDGGTLQVGIGSMGDAVVNALLLRHNDNPRYRELLARLTPATQALVAELGGDGTFDKGLYGATEMLVDGFLDLFEHGILKRRVYDDSVLQGLLNDGRIGERPDAAMLRELVAAGAVGRQVCATDMAYLQHWGIVRGDVVVRGERLVLADGSECVNDLLDGATQACLADGGLGDSLRHACVAHGGFFLGPRNFYARLQRLPAERRRLLQMTSVGRINQLYGNEQLDKLQRTDARFVNSCLMVTLNGAVVSDTLEDGRVLSGVGGQYNFVAMAHAVAGGRSILKVRSTRNAGGELSSNIVFNYGSTTIPRHLRDIVVTEYGIADLRGKTDAECMAAMIDVADSRFQNALLEQAQRGGKLPVDYRIADEHRHNTPAALSSWLGAPDVADAFARFPFGTDLTEQELRLGKALRHLQAAMSRPGSRLAALAGAVLGTSSSTSFDAALERMDLSSTNGAKEWLSRRLLLWALRRSAAA